MQRHRLAFMGTPDFAAVILDALIAARHDIAAVYCQPPRQAGRGQRILPSPVQIRAEAAGLPVRHPARLGAEDARDFAALDLNLAVVAAYGLILPKPVLEAPRRGCLNVHASLLPRWRGAAPIERAILAGDAETGVSIMCMEEGLDTGPVLLAESWPIPPDATAASLRQDLAALGARLILSALDRLDELHPTPQPEEGVTYAKKLARAEERIDWRGEAGFIARQVRALPCWFEAKGERIKLLAAEPGAGSAAPGTVLDRAPTIACGAGALRLLRLQRAGRSALDGADFLRGFDLPPGSQLPCPASS
ncbi:MAG TPA: methionyl-tRNA formyltransferase [Stellaceae bacterium]|jgi:methionyl-tRNA formyltransferase|nr:methionyl-tRNA formyltransferase [Stellaceae bacterium]